MASVFNDFCPEKDPSVKPCRHYVIGGFCTKPHMYRCPEWLARNKPRLSYSAIKDFSQCHLKFWYGWVQGQELITLPKPLLLGSYASKILGFMHDEKNEGKEMDLFLAFIDQKIEESKDPDSDTQKYGDQDLWTLRGVFSAYFNAGYAGVKGITEKEFNWDELDYPTIHGFIDMVSRGTIGYEFKYAKDAEFYSKFTIEEQLTTYFIGDPELQSFHFIVIVKPLLRCGKKESMAAFSERVRKDVEGSHRAYINQGVYWRNEFNAEGWKEKTKRVALEITRYLDEGKPAFYDNRLACYTPGRCQFLDVCSSGGLWPENLYKKRNPR